MTEADIFLQVTAVPSVGKHIQLLSLKSSLLTFSRSRSDQFSTDVETPPEELLFLSDKQVYIVGLSHLSPHHTLHPQQREPPENEL